MVLGDGIRYNVASVSKEERNRLRDAFVKLHDSSDPQMKYPDGFTYWAKVNNIHYWSHEAGIDIHGGPAFLPWHREILNRLEKQLQQADKVLGHDGKIMLHYWDWTEDPRDPFGNGSVKLLVPEFMGKANGVVGDPFANFESTQPGHPFIWRDVNGINGGGPGAPPKEFIPDDETVVAKDTYPGFREDLEFAHNYAHGYMGGGFTDEHYAFTDPWVIILHCNVDRLWAKWQTTPGNKWRLKGDSVYGDDASNPALNINLQPWAGDFEPVNLRLRPWAPPENWKETKTYKDTSIVIPPHYDTNR
jgi:hypothetical protein